MLLTASRAGFMLHCDSKHLFKVLNMKKFSDLVPKTSGNLTGTKYHVDAILNREIHLTGYKLAPPKHNSEPCLTLQYAIEEPLTETGPDGQSRPVIDDAGQPVTDWVEHITFTGSQALIRQLEGVEMVTANLIEKLFTADLAFLQDMYQRINDIEPPMMETVCPDCGKVYKVPLNFTIGG